MSQILLPEVFSWIRETNKFMQLSFLIRYDIKSTPMFKEPPSDRVVLILSHKFEKCFTVTEDQRIQKRFKFEEGVTRKATFYCPNNKCEAVIVPVLKA